MHVWQPAIRNSYITIYACTWLALQKPSTDVNVTVQVLTHFRISKSPNFLTIVIVFIIMNVHACNVLQEQSAYHTFENTDH